MPRSQLLWVFIASCFASVAPLTGAVSGVPSEDVVRAMNRGVGLMEQYRFTDAASAFEDVVRRAPNWAAAHVNLGIAYLNAVSDPGKPGGALDRAEIAFTKAIQLDPKLPNGTYCLGILYRYKGNSDAALEQFQKTLELDPQDADTLYFIGSMYLSKGDAQTASDYFRRSLIQNPYLLSSHYSLAQALIRLGKRDDATKTLETFRRLDSAKVGVKRAITYTEMGHYADVIRVYPHATDAPASGSTTVRFVKETLSGVAAHVGNKTVLTPSAPDATGLGGALAFGDVDGDGDADIFAPARRLADGSVRDVVYLRANAATNANPLPAASTTTTLGVFGDVDNDGDTDLVRVAPNAVQLFKGNGKGAFSDVSATAKLAAPRGLPTAISWVDSDHDGDLDLLTVGTEGVTLCRNNGDGTFLDVTLDSGLASIGGEPFGLALADFDADTDVDFLILTRKAGPQLYLNDRLNRWSNATARSRLRNDKPGTGVVAADFDKDGFSDIVLLNGESSPARFFRNRGDATFELFPTATPVSGIAGTLLDFDNDGDLDLFFAQGRWASETRSRGILLANDGTGRFANLSSDAGLDRVQTGNVRSVTALDVDDDGDTDVILARNGESPVLLRNDGGNKNRWLTVQLRGTTANRSGYGAVVEVKAGSLWQRLESGMVVGVTSSSSPHLHIGLGTQSSADFIRIVWPNAVLQSELEVGTNQRLTIAEVQRKASSCPVLFVWNGDRFEFVTDFMGGGGVGFFAAPDTYAPPDPTERVRIPPDAVKTRDGEYVFEIMEPLEEVAYVDRLALIAVDHPTGTEVFPDERFATGGPAVTDHVYAYTNRIYPVKATDGQGRDVLDAIRRADRVYPPLTRDGRFLGYLNGEHALTLDFGDALASFRPERPWVLNLYGWIEYPYSHIVYAAQQAGLAQEGISVDVLEPDGSWREIIVNAGYPAGMPKTMTLDLRAYLNPSSRVLRLRTNLEIYLDDVFIAEDVSDRQLRLTTRAPDRATLRHAGYPREYTPDGRMPRLYDYTSLDATYAFRNMKGRYTAFGDVRELLTETDDCSVVMGRGEAMTVAFDAGAFGPVPDGYTRTFLVDTFGYCKDMDLYTAYPDTVEPLPFQAMSAYPYAETESFPDTERTRAYRDRCQTRIK
jgi:Tfp pilus assembly protein PilF